MQGLRFYGRGVQLIAQVGGDTAEMQGRYSGDTAEIQGRYMGDRGRYTDAVCS